MTIISLEPPEAVVVEFVVAGHGDDWPPGCSKGEEYLQGCLNPHLQDTSSKADMIIVHALHVNIYFYYISVAWWYLCFFTHEVMSAFKVKLELLFIHIIH